jgi:hypothetical protein
VSECRAAILPSRRAEVPEAVCSEDRWEQGRSKPNEQAAALIWLMRKYPDTLKRLESLSAARQQASSATTEVLSCSPLTRS